MTRKPPTTNAGRRQLAIELYERAAKIDDANTAGYLRLAATTIDTFTRTRKR